MKPRDPEEPARPSASNEPTSEVRSLSQQTTRITYGRSGEPEWIGSYHVLQPVGTGGMGVVYEAEQLEPVRRRVAVKLMKTGLESRDAVARFESERQALALMNHPHIARVFDAGTTDQGRPFFVMEFVQGAPITEYCDRRRLTTSERLGLFVRVCEAVQHAHQKGIIHRDLKPSNVLVSDQDGAALPKIIDFGVAKTLSQRLTDKTLYTQLGLFLGTPEYSSPEQAEMSGDVDTRADVYSLGMLLYELLVGRLPFDHQQLREAGASEMLRVIREEEPMWPSSRLTTLGEASELAERRRTDPASLRRQLRGDLDWIVLKALEKDRGRRYQTASELAADLIRHQRHEPVAAGPQSAGYRLSKFVRRHRAGVTFSTLLIVLLTGFAATMAVQRKRIIQERDRANAEAERANREAQAAGQVTDFLVDLFQVSDPREARGSTITAREILDRGSERIERELTDAPLQQARMMETMGRVYQNQGLYADAAKLLEGALAIRRHELPDMHPDIARNMSLLGWVHAWRRQFDQGLELERQALAIQEKVLPEDHIDTAWSLYYLSSSLIGLDCFSEARDDLDRARRVFEKRLGDSHWSVAWCWNDIGLTFLYAGIYDRAQEAFRHALDIQRANLPPDHPDLATHLINLAEAMIAIGDYGTAEPVVSEAMRLTEKVFPPDHPLFAYCYQCRGDILLSLGSFDEAAASFQRAKTIQRNKWGEISDEFARTLHSTATLALRRGDRVRADSLLQLATETLDQVHPHGHIYAVEVLEDHADLLHALDRDDEARALTERARLMRERLMQRSTNCD